MEATAVVVFFLMLSLPGQMPVPYQEQSASLAACLADVREILTRISPSLAGGGSIQAGCVVKPEPFAEH